MSRGSEAARRLSRTVESSNSSSDWNERPRPRRERRVADSLLMSLPSRISCPPEAIRVKPVTASISEVLPAPFGPISPSTWPGRTVRVASSTAVVPPYFTLRFFTSSVIGATLLWPSPVGAGSTRFAGTFGARNGISLPSLPRMKASWAICSLTMPFWFSSSSTIRETPPISEMYLPRLPSIVFSRRSEKAPGARVAPITGPNR